jgi:hypothetical protein
MRWLHVERAVVEDPSVLPATSSGADQIVRIVVERIAEDEALRGNLTDDAFKPIVDWVMTLIPAAARRSAPETESDEASEQLSQATRRLIRALVQAVSDGDASPLANQFGPPLFTSEEAERAARAVPSEPLPQRSTGERAVALIGALSSALSAKQG